MNLRQFARAQARIALATARLIARVLRPFLIPELNLRDWVDVLATIYPVVEKHRWESAQNGRSYYDYEREQHGLPRQEELLDSYDFDHFRESMDKYREDFIQKDAPEHVLDQIVAESTKQVENGGRRQIIKSVEKAPERLNPNKIVGWARVATGAETCAWCLMMVSRGPVYQFASTAGIDLDDSTALDMYQNNEDMKELMIQWHPNCDCKVVPVFDRSNWPGRDAYQRAEQIWRETTGPYSGRDKLNAFRRKIERGEIDLDAFTGIAA